MKTTKKIKLETIEILETEGKYTIQVSKEERKRIMELCQQGLVGKVESLSMC